MNDPVALQELLQGMVSINTGLYAALGLLTVVASFGITYGVIKTNQKETERRLGSLETSRTALWEKANGNTASIAGMGATLAGIDSNVKSLMSRGK